MFASLMNQTRSLPVRRPLLRRAFLLALIPAVVLAGRIAKSEVVRVPAGDGSEWSIEITPASKSIAAVAIPDEADVALPPLPAPPRSLAYVQAAAAPEAPAETPPPAAEVAEPPAPVERQEGGIVIAPLPSSAPQVSDYERIYNAIPFNRTEYLANPSYRHEMAMELLTGNQRQIVVHRNYTPKLNTPTPRSPLFLYNRYGGYYGGGMGYAPGPYGYGLGFNYTPGYPPAFRYFMPLEDLY